MMIKQPTLIKNKCKGCNKFILMHNKILVCSSCEIVVHSKCAKKLFQYNQPTECWQCNNCIADQPPRYNPFVPVLIHDKHEPVHLDEFDDISEINKIHESCKAYNKSKFSNLLKSSTLIKSKCSCVCNSWGHNVGNVEMTEN